MSDLLGPAYVSARWGFYLAGFLVIGASSFAPFFFGAKTAFQVSFPDEARKLRRRAAVLGLVGAIALLLFGVLRLWMQSRTLLDPEEPLTSEFLRAVLGSTWGRGWQRQIAAAVIGTVGFAAVTRGAGPGWIAAAVSGAGVALTTGMTGHAATAEAGRAGWLLDAVHVGAGGIWLGGLVVLMFAGLGACRALSPDQRPRAHRLLVGQFSRRALIAGPVTIAFGAWLGARYLGWTWPLSFFRSSYGWALAVKIAIVVAVAGLGASNCRYVQPRLEQPAGESRLRRFGAAELVFGVMVLGITAVLVALSFSEHGR